MQVGPIVYIVTIIDHSISFTQKVGELQHYTELRIQDEIELGLDDSCKVANDPNHIQCDSKNIQHTSQRFKLHKSDIKIVSMSFCFNKHIMTMLDV